MLVYTDDAPHSIPALQRRDDTLLDIHLALIGAADRAEPRAFPAALGHFRRHSAISGDDDDNRQTDRSRSEGARKSRDRQKMATDGTHTRTLFGGAFSVTLPPHSIDVSDIREIPDNQEVFLHSATDQSIIVELLEYQRQVPDVDAARYHFEDVTAINGALGEAGTEVLSVEPMGRDQMALRELSSVWFLSGRQHVAKFNEQAKNTVNIHLALFRLPQYTTDILVTFNDPTMISPHSSSVGLDPSQSGGSSSGAAPCWTPEQFHAAVRSLRLLDPAVFS
ncbi:ran guanine nucleotide release factor isoform X2 [Leucoraja erinacea]|uniref:ran guanine nucleotide release factor isoform X2 n=1 Tax=Leucoraja erinaceus TaxID=7782 RepID=UPI002458069B|nr:ran guanine nucleotide release factor isoform X2 [Leucoraja erinacea]